VPRRQAPSGVAASVEADAQPATQPQRQRPSGQTRPATA